MTQKFIEYSNDMDDNCRIQSKWNTKNIVFDDMIADMLSNKKLNPIVTELFLEKEN